VLTLLGNIDQVPDLARSALALIFRIVPVANMRISDRLSGRTERVMGRAARCMGECEAAHRFLTSLIYWSSALDA
jgi:hypothetical protein